MRQSQIDHNRRVHGQRIRMARDAVDAARADLRGEQQARDEFELRLRPDFPTPDIRIGIEDAVVAIKRRENPKTHQGRRLSGNVTVHGVWGYIWVPHGSPYGEAANGYLWRFTEGEIQDMRDKITSMGVTLETDWSYEQGHTFVVGVAK